ncbi:MAG: DUF115 domain-containing protein [Methanobacteriota archaeon]|nr:MAG: DUF115 domain-containing protein [Euryarchaeota archaeon]
MDFEAWEPFYVQILKDFGFSRADDEAVAAELDRILAGTRASDADLRRLIRGKEVTVAGNATSVALASGKLPSVLVTDLDGNVADQLKANQEGTVAVVHAHGDNGPAVREWAPRFSGATVATTQSRPVGGLRNFGGFTDGDRAVFLADHFGARRIHLVGFDFERPNEKDLDRRMKQRKLDWAFVLLSSLDRDDLEL